MKPGAVLPVLPGDGIGPVVVREALRVLRAVGFEGRPVLLPFGLACWEETGEVLPARTERAVRRAGVALLGAATTPSEGPPSPILTLRRTLGLDLLVRPVSGAGWDIVLVGAAFEGLYGSAERSGPAGAVTSRRVTPDGVERLVIEAFRRAHRRVTFVDKPTVFRHSASLIRAVATREAPPGVPWELVNADAFVGGLVRRPADYDVIAGFSFVSDLLSDLSAALADGVPAAASLSLGDGVAVFEPVHGSAPRRASEVPPRVNPLGAIRAAAMLLDHLGDRARARRVRSAVRLAIESGVATPDLGGAATTEELGRAIAAALPAA